MINDVIETNLVENEIYSKYTYQIQNDKIIRCYYETFDKDKLNNYIISYCFIKKYISNNFNDDIFANYEFSEAKAKIAEIVKSKKNECFVVLDIRKAFYTTKLENIINAIQKEFDPITENELYTHLNILFEFLMTVGLKFTKGTLPITIFSQLVFKIYMICLFKNIKNTLVSYVDDFIIYGNRENIFEKFNNFKNIIKNKYSISTMKIYDKIINDKLEMLKTEFKFDKTDIVEKINAFEQQTVDKDITINMKIELSLEESTPNKSTKTVIDIVSPEQLLSLFNSISDEEDKKISHFTKLDTEENICKVCCENKKTHALDACGHVFCSMCLIRINKRFCPFCRKPYKRSIELYDI